MVVRGGASWWSKVVGITRDGGLRLVVVLLWLVVVRLCGGGRGRERFYKGENRGLSKLGEGETERVKVKELSHD